MRMKKKERPLRGDREATIAKAEELLDFVREEMKKRQHLIDPSDRKARAEVREIANKGWLALSTAADAWRLGHGMPPAESAADMRAAYGSAGIKALAHMGAAYTILHKTCGYDDNLDACQPKSIKEGVREAGQAINILSRALVKARRR